MARPKNRPSRFSSRVPLAAVARLLLNSSFTSASSFFRLTPGTGWNRVGDAEVLPGGAGLVVDTVKQFDPARSTVWLAVTVVPASLTRTQDWSCHRGAACAAVPA